MNMVPLQMECLKGNLCKIFISLTLYIYFLRRKYSFSECRHAYELLTLYMGVIMEYLNYFTEF